MEVVLAVLFLCSVADVTVCSFKTITRVADPLTKEVYHVFSSSSDQSACVVIPDMTSTIREVVFQPGILPAGVPRTLGEFRVEVGSDAERFGDVFGLFNQSCKVECPPDDLASHMDCGGNPATMLGCCVEKAAVNGDQPPYCDLLVFKPGVHQQSISGEFLIQYVPRGMSEETINLRVRFSSPGIFYSGNSSTPVIVMEGDTTINFTLWPSSGVNNQMPCVCEILGNGVVENSSKLIPRTPRIDRDSCILPVGVGTVPALFNLRANVNRMALTPGTTSRLFLTPGSCTTINEQGGVTIILQDSATTTGRSTMATSSAATATTMPVPTEGDVWTIIIGVCAAGVSAGLLLGIIIVIICCVVRIKRRRSSPISPNPEGEVELKKLDEEEDVKAGEKLGDYSHRAVGSTNDYIQLPLLGQQQNKAHRPHVASTVAFVTASDSDSYKQLEHEILTQHSCERAQPVAASNSPTLDEYWNGIARLLKRDRCLVYIIWSGALETVNGTHYPPIKKLVCSLADRPLQIHDSRGTCSVMHKLVFLQLGSKGNVDHLVSNLNSTTIFWEQSPEDNTFDAKQCARYAYRRVNERLTAQCEMEKTKRLKQSSPLKQLTTGQVVVVGESVDGTDSLRLKELLENQHREMKDLMEKQQKENVERFDGVDRGVGFIQDKIVDRDLGGENDLDGDISIC